MPSDARCFPLLCPHVAGGPVRLRFAAPERGRFTPSWWDNMVLYGRQWEFIVNLGNFRELTTDYPRLVWLRLHAPKNSAWLCSHNICSICVLDLLLPFSLPSADGGIPVVSRQDREMPASDARRPVSRVLSRLAAGMAIHLGRPLPDASRDLPERRRGEPAWTIARPTAPIWSCSRWGLPCRPRRRGRGALLPHPFTLAA